MSFLFHVSEVKCLQRKVCWAILLPKCAEDVVGVLVVLQSVTPEPILCSMPPCDIPQGPWGTSAYWRDATKEVLTVLALIKVRENDGTGVGILQL